MEATHQIFKVSKSTIQKREKQLKETGDLEKKELDRSFRKIDPEKLMVEDEQLIELSERIKEFGMAAPILTRSAENRNGYEVIAGQQRVRAAEVFPQGDNAPADGGKHYPSFRTGVTAQAEPGQPVELFGKGGAPAGAPPLCLMGGYTAMAKKVVRPKIKVQPVYSDGADMREVFISLLVDTVRQGKYPVRTFENVKDTHYNKSKNQEKEVI